MAFPAPLAHAAIILGLIAVAALLTRLMIGARILDHPNGRSSHDRPVPRCGGVAIVVTVYLGLAMALFFGAGIQIPSSHAVGFAVAAAAVAGIGLLDDLGRLGTAGKLAGQTVAAAILAGSGVILDTIWLPGAGVVALGWLAYPVTVLWVVWLTNIFNFMDGLDGLAAGVAAVACLFLAAVALGGGAGFVAIFALTLMSACIGFLLFNRPPARIFMGDVGSQFIGFSLAAMAVIAAQNEPARVSFLVVPLLMFHFLFDTGFTFLRRLAAGENVTKAHRAHLYQLMNRLGFSHGQVALLHAVLGVFQGLAALYMTTLAPSQRPLVFIPFLVVELVYLAAVLGAARRKGLLG